MRSRLSMHADLNSTMDAILLDKVELHTGKNIPTKVYVPVLMPLIKKGKPKTKKCPTKGKSILKSAKKPALSGSTLKEANYLDATKFKNENGRELRKLMEQLSSYISSNITKVIDRVTVHTVNPKSFKYILEKDSKIKVTMVNGKISNILYDVTNDSKLTYSMI